MLVKEKVLQIIEKLPDTFSLDDLVDHMALLEKMQTGLEQSANNEVLSTKEAKNHLKKWLQ